MGVCDVRPDRKNGLTWPTNILQLLAIFVLVSFTIVHFVLIVQYTYGAVFYFMITISTMLCACTAVSKTICTVLDPADMSLRGDPKSTYGKEKLPFDRAKQGHVITVDSYCQICTTTVDLSSRHCSQCNKCIRRFDHHCDYINNCVGKLNYLYYIGLLLSASLYSLIVITNILYILYNICFNEQTYLDTLGRGKPTIFGYEVSSAAIISLLVILLVLALIAFILVSNLSRLHLYLIYHGWTTWDYYCRPKDDRAQHSYWKYQAEQPRTELSLTELSSGPSSTELELRGNSGRLSAKLCKVIKPINNKTSPMPPHTV